ncbi:hypothetical protein JYU34_018055 [Plutella xylostella]|uniref:Uncharacterized protein n=1 Tax=Plutella xylostella TaxID=51655 RepID=A0ABQ7Q0F8_PLUXY|nr:hypothetical protein JYU34_018055 [Plutella xylostella]
MSKVQTFFYLNIGVSGLEGRAHGLSPVKLCIKPVSRDALLARSVNLDRRDIEMFDFDEIDDQYEAGKSLINYDLNFDAPVARRLLAYIDAFPKPAVLVSYSGCIQNYPIIRSALARHGLTLPDTVQICDLLQAIRVIEGDFKNSYKFPDVYERVTKKIYKVNGMEGKILPHIKMMVECSDALLDKWIEWVDVGRNRLSLDTVRLPQELRKKNNTNKSSRVIKKFRNADSKQPTILKYFKIKKELKQ